MNIHRPLSFAGMMAIVTSFFLAFLLSILPLPDVARLFWPEWLPLVLIFWVIAIPDRIGLGTAWLLGLLLDALYGSVLGKHALALSVVAYLTSRLHQQVRMFPLPQQALSILGLILVYQALVIWIQGVVGVLGDIRWFWLPAVISMLIWPWLYMILASCQRRLRIV